MKLEKELQTAKDAALNAGKAILKYYKTALDVEHKTDAQPVTQADLEANQVIKDALTKAFPNDGWLSEEDLDDSVRFSKDRLWVIDPLDGTKDFINHNPEFAVSIGLVQNQKPLLGVVYNPATDELFSAIKGCGAFCNDKQIQIKKPNSSQKPELLVSMSEYKRGEWSDYQPHFTVTPTGGCAFKMGKIARGDADGTFTLSPKSEWDICAGHIIIEEAGGIVKRLDGSDVVYNQEAVLLDGLIYVNGQELLDKVLELIPSKNF